DPIALGEALFRTAVPTCQACHSMAPGVSRAGPSLAGIESFFQKIQASREYKGKATSAEAFIRDSTVAPSAFLHPGPMYSAGGTSFMPTNYGQDLSEEQIDQLVAYLMSFK